jgi:CMP-N-acetylneuraminic acid synthetase
MSIIALVPMKGHSERIPGKNLKVLCGKPLFAWIIDTLKECSFVKEIVVNTDSKEISKLIQKRYSDVIIHERPQELCGDFVSMNKIIEYDLSKISGNLFLQTHSTNPLLTKNTLEKAAEIFKKYQSVFSVTRYQSRFYDSEFKPINHNPEELIRTQDLPPIYEENSNFYFFTREVFNKNKMRVGSKPFLFEMDALEAVDLDYPVQWALAEALIKNSTN